jgi:hypothetical protein
MAFVIYSLCKRDIGGEAAVIWNADGVRGGNK